ARYAAGGSCWREALLPLLVGLHRGRRLARGGRDRLRARSDRDHRDDVGAYVARAAARGRGRAGDVACPGGPLEAPRRVERRRVVAAERRDLHDVAGVWRMDELAAADVDPDMAGAGEEDEVTRLELADRHRRPHTSLCIAAVGQRDADLSEDVHDEPGAIEAAR